MAANTLSESLEYAEGVADTSIIVPVCFQNPLKMLAVKFLEEALTLKRRIAIPVTAIFGAYHIATRYLRAPRSEVKKILVGLLQTRSPALYPRVDIDVAIDSLDVAAIYKVESWDGYIISLAGALGTKTIFTLDRELGKVAGIRVEMPFPKQMIKQYHEYVTSLVKGGMKG